MTKQILCENSYCHIIQIVRYQIVITEIATKFKLLQSSNCDKTTVVSKLKLLDNSNCDKTHTTPELWLVF